MRLSSKPVRPCSPEHRFIFDPRLAQDIDPVTKKKCIVISIGSKTEYIPVGEPVEISEAQWMLLNSIGGYLPSHLEYDPIAQP